MEIFDVVDCNRKKLNYTKTRGETLLDNEYNIGVELWIFNNHKLLMTKRSIKKSHPLKWEIPGGCSQSNESSIDTLIREIKEELGISIKDSDYKFLETSIYKKQFIDIYKSNIKINHDKIILQKDEVCDINFFTKEEFLKMAKNDEIVKSVFERYNLIKDKIDDEW